jgi:UDP:flavonoid glycosyltransferase YjiC (YdhE family)
MKILAIANAHALAHVSRLLEVAKVLRGRGHQVLFAGHGKYLKLAEWDDFKTRELPYISVEQVIRAVRTQKLWELYREVELQTFINAELALYAEFEPDLVLIDNRPTARTSAEQAGLKTAGVLNVHMSNYRRIPFFSYTQLAGTDRLPGLALADRAENAIECRVYDRLVMGDLNKIRSRLGLRRLFAYEHEEGDLTLLADIPEFNPVLRLPDHAKYIGPLTWHNSLAAPSCLTSLEPGIPTAYFSLGSEGLEELVTRLGELAAQGMQIIVATGATKMTGELNPPKGVFLEQYVNTDLLLPHCDIVCCHGGNGTLYQALAFGLPIVVVATHAEQYYGGKRIRQLGLGKAMTLSKLRREGIGRLVQTVRDVISAPSYGRRAQAFAGHLRGWRSAHLAADSIEESVRT